ncbi:surface antigen-domain-containing protein [Gorgonomyces haynaldii]|nr:surface antigen-domain-containing protein [Gorgonomyces haynaldii]
MEKSVRVNAVKIHGIVHTDHEFLTQITAPLLKAKTLDELLVGSRNVANVLGKLDIFETVQVELDSPNSQQDSVDVVYRVKERKRLFARTGAEFGNHDGNLNFSINIRNVFGRAETLAANTLYGLDTGEKFTSPQKMGAAKSHQIVFTKPLLNDQYLELSGYALDRGSTIFKPFAETLTGLNAKFTQNWFNLKYTAQYDLTWRELHSLSPNASIQIRKDAGHSLKSSVSHSLVYDSRDDQVHPNTGALLKAFQELAGLGGDVRFFKTEASAASAHTLGPFTLISSVRGGALLPLNGDHTRISDKFFMGGPQSVRGFRQHGIGPREKDDSLGGEVYVGGSCGLQFKVPALPYHHVRGQLFVNGGSLAPLQESLKKQYERLLYPSIACGVGIACRFTSFKIELNYCLPLVANTTDQMKPGVQFGIGLEFY